MNSLLTWESVDQYTKRAKVIGGWLVKSYENFSVTPAVSMCFVPDEGHYWKSDWSKT